MPRLNELERFKSDLAALSHEEQVLARWGEEREYPPPPETEAAAPEPGKSRAQRPRASSKPAPAGVDQGLPPDFASLLADLPLDLEPDTPPKAAARPAAPVASAPSESADILDGLEELGGFEELGAPSSGEAAPSGEGLEGGDFDLEAFAAMPGLVDETPRSEALPGLDSDSFAMPDFGEALEEAPSGEGQESSGYESGEPAAGAEVLGADLAEDMGFGEPPAEGGSPETGDLAATFDLPADFGPDTGLSFGEEEGSGAQPAEESTVEAAPDFGESTAPDFGEGSVPDFGESTVPDFGEAAVPDFGEASVPDIGESAPADFGEAAPMDFGEASPTDFGEPAPADAGLDEFSIPDFGGETAPARPAGGTAASGASASGAAQPAAEDSFSMPDLGGFEAGGSQDAFDGFSLDSGGFGEASLGGDLDSQLAALGEDLSTTGTFNLEKDWGAGFEVPGEPAAKPEKRAPVAERSRAAAPASEEKVRPVSLTEEQVDRLQDRLLSFPLNLRLAVEDAIANEQGTEAQRSRLIWGLVERKPFDEMAALVSRMLKRRITVPDGYEKSTGADFQAEQGSFRYAFKHTILPILRIGLVVLVAASILGYLGWRFVYKPLAADALYRSGYSAIGQDRYAEAESAFARAGKLREFLVWYYRYAEAYAARRQFGLAEAKYGALLALHPAEYQGALDWAALERRQLKYREAEDILRARVLEKDYHNKDALLLAGDIFLDWADEDPSKLEEARRSYATLIQDLGMQDLYLGRMLLYFMRVDKLSEVLPLKDHFMALEKQFLDAPTLAELGGYLLDKGRLEEVHPVLKAAVARDRTLPEAHYELARYFKTANSPAEERKALDNAILTLGKLEGLTPRREAKYIDALVRRGDSQLAAREYIGAEADYAAASAEYEKALALGRVKRGAGFAAAWAGLGEVAYWQRDDFTAALSWFERAAADGYDSPAIRYQRGAILYQAGRPREALEQFHRAGLAGNESPYLLYAFGNTLYQRGDWLAAEGYYRRTAKAMQKALAEISFPLPGERASHAEITELLMEAQNNLGAALYQAGFRAGDARKRAEAMSAFAESTRLFDSLMRDQAALERSGSTNLGLENVNLLLKPPRGATPAIYPGIEKGMAFPKH